MLKQGIYKSENDGGVLNQYEIVIDVKETDKSFIFKLVRLDSRYSADHIRLMFAKSDKVIIRKQRSEHAMRVWGDDDFTIYPYQAGIPFYFKLIKGEYKETAKEKIV